MLHLYTSHPEGLSIYNFDKYDNIKAWIEKIRQLDCFEVSLPYRYSLRGHVRTLVHSCGKLLYPCLADLGGPCGCG